MQKQPLGSAPGEQLLLNLKRKKNNAKKYNDLALAKKSY